MQRKLMFGDCLEEMKNIPDGSVDLVLTDPPYGISFRSNYRKTKYKKIMNDENLEWVEAFLLEISRIARDNTAHYLFCSYHNIDYFKYQIGHHFNVKNILVWKKNNTSMGDLKGDFAPMVEFIIFFQKGRRLIEGKRTPNIFEFKKTGNKFHPTEKPVDLCEHLISKFSKPNQIVLDPFMGSGSTGVAAKNLNRNFIGIEKDKEYFEIAKKRIENH